MAGQAIHLQICESFFSSTIARPIGSGHAGKSWIAGKRHCLTCTPRPAHAYRLELLTHTLINSTSSELATSRPEETARQRAADQTPGYHGLHYLHGDPLSPRADPASRDFPGKPIHTMAPPNLAIGPSHPHTTLDRSCILPPMETAPLKPLLPTSYRGRGRRRGPPTYR